MLTENKIRQEVYSNATYSKGLAVFKAGNVRGLSYDKPWHEFSAVVRGTTLYGVAVTVTLKGDIHTYNCDCEDFDDYDGPCEHIVATMFDIQAKWHTYFSVKKDPKVQLTQSENDLFRFFNQVTIQDVYPDQMSVTNPIKVVSVIHSREDRYTGKRHTWLEFMIGTERLYVMKSVKTFVEAVLLNKTIVYGKGFTLNPLAAQYDKKSEKLVEILKTAYNDELNLVTGSSYYPNYNSAFSDDRKFKLSNSNLLKFMAVIESEPDEPFTLVIDDQKVTHVRLENGRPDFKVNVSLVPTGLQAALDCGNDNYYGLDADLSYLYRQQIVYKVDTLFSKYIAPLMKCFQENGESIITIPHHAVDQFISNVVPALEKVATVKMDGSVSVKYFNETLEKQVYFNRLGDGISAKVVFKYGDFSINPASRVSQNPLVKEGKSLLRALPQENLLLQKMLQFGFVASEDAYILVDEEKTYQFLASGLDDITTLAEVYYADDFKPMSAMSKSKISCGVRVNTGTGLLELNFNYDDISANELMGLLASYQLKKRYHRLKTGQFIGLDSSSIQTAAEMMDQLNLSQADLEKQHIELPMYRAMYIDSLAREKDGFQIERSSGFKRLVQDVSEPQDMEYELPQGIQGKLRDYQKIGYKWLKTLSHYGFGGILADDMGLGKTLQIITLVKSCTHQKKPSLVIAPTSLVYNWQEEVKKFAPDLVVTVLAGAQTDRREKFSAIEGADIVVTTYGMIKRDIELYKELNFQYCFIDEAQHIKNPNTLNAKSVKQIKAGGYFALTGTPVENTLTELWSIFDFVMPGYLLSHHKFLKKFETPIVKNGDQAALKELGRHIKPFVLRRMKKDVLLELPDKIESKMLNEMTPEQQKIYKGYVLQAQKEFQNEVSANGFQNSRIKILAILTRLRQICCHPSLFIDNYEGGSGKLAMLKELIEDGIDGGHRILVFSQFTSMLAIIKSTLEHSEIKYHYLDGTTSAQDRIARVNAFNGGEHDVFLISLKAGGTGLNLTGADMVIHYDPWWNPAVEDQATDRAYRIGQKNVVQVFKLITMNTLEEKIFELQQKKKVLIDAVIKPGENFLTKMTEAEVKQLFELA